jgi:hypothetical protein
MTSTITTLQALEGLLGFFEAVIDPDTGQAIEPAQVRFPLPLYGARLFHDIYHRAGRMDQPDQESSRRFREADHYALNVSLLFNFILMEATPDNGRFAQVDYTMYRLRIDLEKVLSDIRSFLDSLYQAILPYQRDRQRIPGKRSRSFGKFLDWLEDNPQNFEPPMALMIEISEWAQTIRKLRDNYIHSGHEALVFVAEPMAMILHLARHPAARVWPEGFYVPQNQNNLLRLDKFLTYLTSPINALEHSLGEYFTQRLVDIDPNIKPLMPPFRQGIWIKRQYDLYLANQDVLNGEVFKKRFV